MSRYAPGRYRVKKKRPPQPLATTTAWPSALDLEQLCRLEATIIGVDWAEGYVPPVEATDNYRAHDRQPLRGAKTPLQWPPVGWWGGGSLMPELILPIVDDSVRVIPLQGRDDGAYAVVDLVDYEFASRWKWKAVKSRGFKVKLYAYRTTRWKGRHVSIWLHKEICLRAKGLPPSKEHLIADHENGNSLDDRRRNLDWATHSQNCRNREGVAYQQLRLAIATGDTGRVLGKALT